MKILRFVIIFFITIHLNCIAEEQVNEKQQLNNDMYFIDYADVDKSKNETNKTASNKIETKKTVKKQNKFYNFIRNYFVTEQNPIFKDKNNAFSIFAGYDVNDLIFGKIEWNKLGKQDETLNRILDEPLNSLIGRTGYNGAFSYSRNTKIGMINGRFSVGFFAFYLLEDDIKSNNMNIFGEINGNTSRILKSLVIGGDCIQELVFGHQNLYLSFGIGFSYIFYVKSKYKTTKFNNEKVDGGDVDINRPTVYFNSRFNFVGKVSLGHRFDCGLIVEATWKYYTNAGLADYNRPFSMAGLSIGYAF